VKLGNNLGSATMDVMLAAMIIGTVGGLAGSVFTLVNNKIIIMRKRFLVKKGAKVVECLIILILTVSTMYWAVYIKYASAVDPNNDPSICGDAKNIDPKLTLRQFLCPDGYYDRLATLFFDS
jgi:hypothetical protein